MAPVNTTGDCGTKRAPVPTLGWKLSTLLRRHATAMEVRQPTNHSVGFSCEIPWAPESTQKIPKFQQTIRHHQTPPSWDLPVRFFFWCPSCLDLFGPEKWLPQLSFARLCCWPRSTGSSPPSFTCKDRFSMTLPGQVTGRLKGPKVPWSHPKTSRFRRV